MATWKKVIVSGSDAELNTLFTSLHVTSSANISASGFLYGNLPENDTLEYVVVYNDGGGTHNGRLERKILNLVNAQRAPELYLADLNSSTNDSDQRFRLSYDSGSDTGEPIAPPIRISASLAFGLGSVIESSNTQFLINGAWDDVDVGDDEYYLQGQTNQTASVSEGNSEGPEDARNGLLNPNSAGNSSYEPKEPIRLVLQSVNSVGDYTATPSPSSFDYDPRAFDSPAPGDSGEIRVYVNTMDYASADAVFDIGPTIGAVTTPSNGITPNISVSQSNMDGVEVDATKCYRTGYIDISTTNQVDGYNYAFIFYTGSRGDNQVRALTNFIEWFYDKDGANLAMSYVSENSPAAFDIKNDGSEPYPTMSISGIRYFTPELTGSAYSNWEVRNQYRNVYPLNGGIQCTLTTNTITAASVTQSGTYLLNDPTETDLDANDNNQEINLAPLGRYTQAHTQNTKIRINADVDFGSMESKVHHPTSFISAPFESTYATSTAADINLGFRALHFNKADLSLSSVTFDDFLINKLPSSSNEHQFEDFRGEEYRIVSRSYATTDTIPGTHTWDSNKSISNTSTNGYNTGNLIYASHLVYPTKAGKTADPGNFEPTYGPNQLYDYSSGATTGEREYFRYFKFTSTANGKKAVNIELVGSGKVVTDGNTTNFTTGGDGIKLQVWRTGPSNNTLYSGQLLNALDHSISVGNDLTNTEYIPIASTYSNLDYDGASFNIPGTTTYVPTGVVKFADTDGETFNENDLLIVRIIVPQGWTGNLNAMAIHLGNAAPSNGSILGYSPYTAL